MAMASKGLLTKINEDDMIRIVLLFNFETPSYIKGYHEYQKIQTPFLQEELCGEMEPANPVDKYVVAANKNKVVAGHTETTVRCNEIATFTYIIRMHTCITLLQKT